MSYSPSQVKSRDCHSQAPGHCHDLLYTLDECVPETVSQLAGVRVTKQPLGGLLCFRLPSMGKEIMLPGEALLQFFLFGLYASDVLGHSQFEWLAEKELIGDKLRNVSHKGSSSDSFNLNLLFRSSLFKATFVAVVLVYGIPFLFQEKDLRT